MRQHALLLLFGLLVFGTSCHEDDEAPVLPPVPTFAVGTSTQVEDSVFNEDTFLLASRSQIDIIFSVIGKGRDYDSVAWWIGNDPKRSPTKNLIHLRNPPA